MTLDQYVLVSGSLRYLAQAMDYRENAPDPEAALARTQSMVIGKGVLISSRAIMLGGVEGREVRARLPDGRVRSARFVLRLLQPGGGAETQEFPCDSRARDNA